MDWRVGFVLLLTLGCSVCKAQLSGSALADTMAAAEAGDPAAQDRLAQAFSLRGDSKLAETWYRKAAAQGYPHAQGKLANMLLMRSRGVGGKPAERASLGEEAVKWAVLAANQGDHRGQADLADIYLEGRLVKTDLIQAYKWGDLAARGSLLDTATVTGRTVRDAAILRMSPGQIAEAKRLVAAFAPHRPAKGEEPEPSWVSQIKLAGLSGPANRRLALISGTLITTGETATVNVAGKSVKVRCLEIRDRSTVVEIEGIDRPRELPLTEAGK